VRGDHAFGFDDGVLTCVDLKTGERVWKKGRYGSGQILLLADQGLLLLLSEKGELALVPAEPQEPGEIFLLSRPRRYSGGTGSAGIVNGRAFSWSPIVSSRVPDSLTVFPPVSAERGM
jgi:hypothetical protein